MGPHPDLIGLSPSPSPPRSGPLSFRNPFNRSNSTPTRSPTRSPLPSRTSTPLLQPSPSQVQRTIEVDQCEKEDWFSVHRNGKVGPGSLWRGMRSSVVGGQRYHRFSSSEVPSWVGYSQGALNWDALVNSDWKGEQVVGRDEEGTKVVPRYVLDVGCGIGMGWILEAASRPGWEETQFVGLDVAPCSIPAGILPPHLANRITFVQYNFLHRRLSCFEDNQFDFVRIAHVGLGVPEHKWNDLLEAANRVLSPDCPIEVIDSDFTAYRSRPDRSLALESFLDSSSSAPSTPSDVGDPFLPIDDCLDAVSDKRFINTHSLGIIPAALALSGFKTIVSSGSSRIALPSLPLLPTINEPTTLSTDEIAAPHIYLHAWAERMASASQTMSHDLATRLISQEEDVVPTSSKATPTPLPVIDTPKRLARLQIELNDLIQDWTDDLKSRASLAQILGDRLDWHCVFDEKISAALETNLPIFDVRLEEFEELSAAMEDGAVDPVVEGRKMQFSLAKREGESELKAARKRLGAGWEQEHASAEAKSLGVWEVASFVAKST